MQCGTSRSVVAKPLSCRQTLSGIRTTANFCVDLICLGACLCCVRCVLCYTTNVVVSSIATVSPAFPAYYRNDYNNARIVVCIARETKRCRRNFISTNAESCEMCGAFIPPFAGAFRAQLCCSESN